MDFVQRSMAGGEVAPAVYGRADQVKYQTGLRTCRNFSVRRHGGAENRTGSELVAEVGDSAVLHRLFRFVFNADQTYVLLFGDETMRVTKLGVQLTVSGVTAWSNATAYTIGDLALSGGVNYYCILAHTNQIPPSATYWYAMPAGGIYEIPTPYGEADLQGLYVDQSADVVSLDSLDFAPRELRRYADTRWIFTLSAFAPSQAAPTALVATRGATGAKTFRYKVTAIASETFEESVPGLSNAYVITAITQANPCVATVTVHGFDVGDIAELASIVGMTQLNGTRALVTARSGTQITLGEVNSTAYTAYVSGGTATQTAATTTRLGTLAANITGTTLTNPCIITAVAHGFTTNDVVTLAAIGGTIELNGQTPTITVISVNKFSCNNVDATAYTLYTAGGTATNGAAPTKSADPTSALPHVITWTKVAGAQEYNIYKENEGAFGYIGSSRTASFSDTNIIPDLTLTPAESRNPFNAVDSYPSVVGYYEQRRWHANTRTRTETAWASRSGRFTNYTISSPLQDADALTYTLAGKRVNEIRHIVDIGAMIILTAGGEWVANGDGSGLLTPGTPGLKQVGYNGATDIPPIIVGNNLLYVQARGNLVRDLRTVIANDGTNGYTGDDLTVFAPHLFAGQSLLHWDFAQIPHSTIWAVRSDGVLLGLTYLKAHEIAGWHRHDTDGVYEDCVVVPEGDEDILYVLVKRSIDGDDVRFLERFPSRLVTDIEVDAHFVDCGVTYDGRNTTATTLTITAEAPGVWTYPCYLLLDASAAVFTVADAGGASAMQFVVGEERLTVTVVAFITATQVRGVPNLDVPAAFQGLTTATWTRAVKEIDVAHLEGKTLAVLGDGCVVSNGFDAPDIVVSGGVATLPRPYGVIHAGLPYESDLETLDLDVQSADPMGPKLKQLTHLTVHVESSRGLWAGPTVDQLHERRPTSVTANVAQPVETEKWEVGITSQWSNRGRIVLRQRDPLPLTIVAIMPHGDIGG